MIETPWSSLGYITYKRTYSRPLIEYIEGNRVEVGTEDFPDTVERVIRACDEQLGCGFTEDEEDRLRGYMLQLKGMVAGRFLWTLGTETVNRFGLASLQNCAFCVIDEPIAPFCWAMDSLALGQGVGFSIQRKHIDKLPPVMDWFEAPTRIDDGGADFIIPDSREGWVKFLGKTLKAAFLSDCEEKGTFTYSTQVIRGKGEPIKGFGGTASGSIDLCKGINDISGVLRKRRGKKIRPIDALDIMNIIAAVIVAGNVRRSAELCIGDCDDLEYLLAKRWDLGNVPSWRAMSNNSVSCEDINDLHEFFWQTYDKPGESLGLINIPLLKSTGRLGETQYPDPTVEGVNPCSEQGLAPWETCALGEIFLPNIESKEELMDVSELLYRVIKHSLALPCHQKETERIVHSNMRMGIGVTGVLQSSEEQLGYLSSTYEYLREFDNLYSDNNGFNRSVKLTTLKPSGTLSLLPGVTPGIHPGYAQYMYRRIRIASGHELVELCRDAGYPIEPVKNFDGTLDHGTMVVTFPFSYPEGTILAKDMTALEQLKQIKRLQTIWSDNAVSCTIYFTPEELPGIKRYLERYYKTCHKSLSFMLRNNHGFTQAPYEEITKEVYDALVKSTKPITSIKQALEMDKNDSDCEGGACPIR